MDSLSESLSNRTLAQNLSLVAFVSATLSHHAFDPLADEPDDGNAAVGILQESRVELFGERHVSRFCARHPSLRRMSCCRSLSILE